MKKTIISILLVVSCMSALAQDTASNQKPKEKKGFWSSLTSEDNKQEKEDISLPLNAATNKVSYAEIVDAPGAAKTTLFEKAKKWFASKNSEVNPYEITYENSEDGSIIGKGTFTLPTERNKYVVQFGISISTKSGKFKYEFTDFVIRHRTEAGVSGGGFGYYSGSKQHSPQTFEYSLETFYPARLHGRKPVIKGFEEVTRESIENISIQMQAVCGSLKQLLSGKSDW